MSHVDGYVLAVPASSKARYIELAQLAAGGVQGARRVGSGRMLGR